MLAMLPGQKLFDKLSASPESLAGRSPGLCPFGGRCAPLATGARPASASTRKAMLTFQFARNMVKGMSKNFPAPAKCVDVVEAATKKKFDEGMQVEREASSST